jgi:sporulation protein YlmC with PRC-barrel domain
MKASDLIGSKVYDSEGKVLGHCFDVETTRTGPKISDSWGNSLQVSGLLIGSVAVVQRLGYGRREVRGPIGIRWLAHRLKGYRIRWEQVASVERRVLKLGCTEGDLEPLVN